MTLHRRAVRIAVFVAATMVGVATVPAAFAYLPSGRSVGWGAVAVSGDIDVSEPPSPATTPTSPDTPSAVKTSTGVPETDRSAPSPSAPPPDEPRPDTPSASEPSPTPTPLPSSPDPEPPASGQPVVVSSAPSPM